MIAATHCARPFNTFSHAVLPGVRLCMPNEVFTFIDMSDTGVRSMPPDAFFEEV